ncbi:unnamed protein product [Adineta steineri]|uniref:Uncharacterized protein n=1 Tax=Adineta steineri TaxID=433720 RepID=A0A814T9M1_9BILA|nr:unnamed protein product [Adineta steineri]CAF1158833.1 unnamed protein product [Adineta steineri]
MIKYSNKNDLCLLILLPANNAARKYCNQIESSSTCQIQMDRNHMEKALVYTCINQTKMYENELVDNNNNNSVINSLKNLTIETKQQNKIMKDFIKQRQVKINKKSHLSSPITNTNIPRTFSLWYTKKKKNIVDEHN